MRAGGRRDMSTACKDANVSFVFQVFVHQTNVKILIGQTS